MFIEAAKKKYRFESTIGYLTVEQLWDLPLTTTKYSKDSLDDMAKRYHMKIQEYTGISFVHTSSENALIKELENKKSIILYVIKDIQKTNELHKLNLEHKQKLKILYETLEKKKLDKLFNLSEEQLLEELNKLQESINNGSN